MTGGRLTVDVGFRLWAPSYEHENPLTELDGQATRALAPVPAGGALLDAGCGTGRRLPAADAPESPSLMVGIDLVPAMVLRGRSRIGGSRHLVVAGLEAIPLRPGLFDVVWCRLAIGFVPSVEPAFLSLADQLAPGGRLLVTDLHPDLAAEGADRGFRLDDGVWRAIETTVHPVDRLLEAAHRAGLEPEGRVELATGPEHEEAYRAAGREDMYREHSNRPVLLGVSFRLSPGL